MNLDGDVVEEGADADRAPRLWQFSLGTLFILVTVIGAVLGAVRLLTPESTAVEPGASVHCERIIGVQGSDRRTFWMAFDGGHREIFIDYAPYGSLDQVITSRGARGEVFVGPLRRERIPNAKPLTAGMHERFAIIEKFVRQQVDLDEVEIDEFRLGDMSDYSMKGWRSYKLGELGPLLRKSFDSDSY